MAILGPQFYTILSLDKEFAGTLTDTLERSTLDLLEKLDDALTDVDAEKAKAVLHTIKGGCANYGAEQMTMTARFAEKQVVYLDKSNVEDFKELAKQIHTELKETLNEARSKL